MSIGAAGRDHGRRRPAAAGVGRRRGDGRRLRRADRLRARHARRRRHHRRPPHRRRHGRDLPPGATTGTFSVFADLGAWSVEHPPATDHFITTGVQYALRAVRPRVPGHRRAPQPRAARRPRRVDRRADRVRQHRADRARDVRAGRADGPGRTPAAPPGGRQGCRLRAVVDDAADVAAGASLLVDVEFGRGRPALRAVAGAMGWSRRRAARVARHRSAGQGRVGTAVSSPSSTAPATRSCSTARPRWSSIGDTAYVVGLAGTIVEIDSTS